MLITASVDFVYISRRSRRTEQNRIDLYALVKDAFHYSSQLQTWLQTSLSTRFAARFSTSSCGFAPRFRSVSSSQLAFDLLATKFLTRFAAGLNNGMRP